MGNRGNVGDDIDSPGELGTGGIQIGMKGLQSDNGTSPLNGPKGLKGSNRDIRESLDRNEMFCH